MVTFDGERKPASYHCIDLLDNVGIMNYRDAADGADGLIAHGIDLLEYADQAQAAKVYMGVETFTYPLIEVWFVLGLPREHFESIVKGDAAAFGRLSRVHGFRTQIFDDGYNLHVGIEMPPNPSPERVEKMLGALTAIAEQYGLSSYPDLASNISANRMDADFGFGADVEWMNPRVRDIEIPGREKPIPGFVATSLMLPKITFADESYAYIREQLQASEAWFGRYKSFAGMAIHFYATYLEKSLEKKKDAAQ
jgi:hypothetical protein